MNPALWIYLPAMVVGLGWLLLQNFFGGEVGGDAGGAGEMGEFGDAGVSGHGDATVISPFKPVVLATTLAVFGVMGSLLTWTGVLQPLLVALAATVTSLGAGGLVFRVLVLLARAQANATESAAEFVGLEGELTLGCSDQNLGEVVFDTGRSIQQFSARPYHPGQSIPKGSRVIIRRVSGGIAYVERS